MGLQLTIKPVIIIYSTKSGVIWNGIPFDMTARKEFRVNDMDMQEMKALVRDAVNDADLHPTQIPSIDLYVDQITCLMAENQKLGSARFQDRVLTKTMINNYSKDGLITPVKGKKYSKEQILQMLLVCSLKNTLSISEIKRILQNVYAMPAFDGDGLEKAYEKFLSVKEYERAELQPLMERLLTECALNPTDDTDFFTFILGLSSMSSYLKNTVQALIEARYPDLSAEREREEQERREDAKRQKEEKKEEKKAAARSKKDDTAGEVES